MAKACTTYNILPLPAGGHNRISPMLIQINPLFYTLWNRSFRGWSSHTQPTYPPTFTFGLRKKKKKKKGFSHTKLLSIVPQGFYSLKLIHACMHQVPGSSELYYNKTSLIGLVLGVFPYGETRGVIRRHYSWRGTAMYMVLW